MDSLAKIRVVNREHSGHFDYFILTRIQFYSSSGVKVAELASHATVPEPFHGQVTEYEYEELLNPKRERVVGVKIGCLKSGIPTSI